MSTRVVNTISYVELYDKLKEMLNIDTTLYKMEIQARPYNV